MNWREENEKYIKAWSDARNEARYDGNVNAFEKPIFWERNYAFDFGMEMEEYLSWLRSLDI